MANERSIYLGSARRILDALAVDIYFYEMTTDIEVDKRAKEVKITSGSFWIHISVPPSPDRDLLKNKTAAYPPTTLLAKASPVLDELLTVYCPDNLEKLYAVTTGDFPSVVSFKATTKLTHFVFKTFNQTISGSLEVNLLEFLRNCPQLEEAFVVYSNPRNSIRGNVIRLPNSLRSFTQESPYGEISTGLFYRIVLPKTCNIAFKATNPDPDHALQWDRKLFPGLHAHHDLSRSTMVEIMVSADPLENPPATRFVEANFSKPRADVSLSVHARNVKDAKTAVKNILDFLKSSKIGLFVRALCFESLVGGDVVQLRAFLKGVIKIAELRRSDVIPLKVFVELPEGECLPDGCVRLMKTLKERFDIGVEVKEFDVIIPQNTNPAWCSW